MPGMKQNKTIPSPRRKNAALDRTDSMAKKKNSTHKKLPEGTKYGDRPALGPKLQLITTAGISRGYRLTGRHEAFAAALADGASQVDAYMQAGYSDKQKRTTLYNSSCVLASNPKVITRVAQIRRERDNIRRTRATATVDLVLSRLEHEALSAKSDSARIRALELLGKTAGIFDKEDAVSEFTGLSAVEMKGMLQDRLAAFLGTSADGSEIELDPISGDIQGDIDPDLDDLDPELDIEDAEIMAEYKAKHKM